ncbi:P-loop containing nucleoside triphosphate hydrolase protein [Agrocybe pediades]|nr:P-loop containing nucleoside triphosphate hydrolase protein [Agrocybe pediades]
MTAASSSSSDSLTGAGKAGSGSVLSFGHLSYVVKTKGDEGSKHLIDDISVDIKAGELLAIMGPSGAGKSTLLDVMSFRKPMMKGGSVHLNGEPVGAKKMHKISSFVEQEDALLGVLTVRESISYALRLHLPRLPRTQVNQRVERVIRALGLQSCAEQRIGTPISRGISGGQKRRVTAACAMVTFPRILFLDEVTSGLDSTSAREVVASISALSKAEGMIVIASIHQPSLETITQFTDVVFLAEGKLCYLGRVNELEGFFEKWGRPVGRFTNPSDHAMNFLNSDFDTSGEASRTIDEFRQFYLSTLPSSNATSSNTGGALFEKGERNKEQGHLIQSNDRAQDNAAVLDEEADVDGKAGVLGTLFWNTLVLAERTAINYRRNLLAYGVRAGMYCGMGFMLAVIWIRLGTADSTINDRLSVHFYSVAFLAFMSVAGIPSFLEERAVYLRESKNGLYTTLPFLLSNTLVNIPFLFACTVLFTLICYWAVGLHHGAAPFFRFVAFLFLALFVAETQSLIVASLLPIFVASLAITAFLNGFWMSVGGYFIKARSLPRFWFFSFHYMDFQKYAFELLTNSDFRGLSFSCTKLGRKQCSCAYPSSTPDSCTVSGQDVLNYLDIGGISYAKWTGILVSIAVIFRIILYVSLKARSSH